MSWLVYYEVAEGNGCRVVPNDEEEHGIGQDFIGRQAFERLSE